jgi:hypothetical protein
MLIRKRDWVMDAYQEKQLKHLVEVRLKGTSPQGARTAYVARFHSA